MTTRYCSSRQDLVDAVAAADVIGIDIEVVNFSPNTKGPGVRRFSCANIGRTARRTGRAVQFQIKFKAFLDHAVALGCRPHHPPAITARGGEFRGGIPAAGRPGWHQDQSYFLHRLNRAQLAKTLFPIWPALTGGRCGASPGRTRQPPRRIRRASVSSPNDPSASSCNAICPFTDRAKSTVSTTTRS